MAPRGPAIRQKPSGAWEARYYGPDGRRRGKTFRRKTDAAAFLSTVKADLIKRGRPRGSIRRRDIKPSARRELENLSDSLIARLVPKIEALAANPGPPGCRKLRGYKESLAHPRRGLPCRLHHR